MSTPETLIRMSNITKTYHMGTQSVHALKGVNLDVLRGEYLALLGPSGSGKSTLMNILGCIDTPDIGTYSLAGRDVETQGEDDLASIRNQEIGFIFQKFNLINKYTAHQNVALPLLFRGVERKIAMEKAAERLAAVGLEDRMHHKPMELSGGQQQRVAVARALVGEPSILLADEPTGALDTQTGIEILRLFHQLSEAGHTLILITHDPGIAREAKRIVRMLDGQVQEDYINTERVRKEDVISLDC